jgi:hypothetical protein
MFNAKRKEQFKLVKEVQRCTDQDESADSYDVCYEAEKILKELQQYRSIVGSIDQFDNLIKSEVDTPCLGQVLNLFWPCTESEARERLGHTYDKGKMPKTWDLVETENLTTNVFNVIVSMDDHQVMVMMLINCEQYEELERLLDFKSFEIFEAVIKNMKKTHFDVMIMKNFVLRLTNLIKRKFALIEVNDLGVRDKIISGVLGTLLRWFRNLMKRIDFYNSTKSEVDASGFVHVNGLVRLVTERLAWIIRGCEFEDKRATKLMVQVETENRMNSGLFDNNVSMDDGGIGYAMAGDGSSKGDVVEYKMDKFEEAVDVIRMKRVVVIVDVVVAVIFGVCLLLWIFSYLKFIAQKGNEVIIRVKEK